jgi:hypothetical protein
LHKSKQKLLRTERLLKLDTTEQNDPQNAVEVRNINVTIVFFVIIIIF